jgi:hypothetical protein
MIEVLAVKGEPLYLASILQYETYKREGAALVLVTSTRCLPAILTIGWTYLLRTPIENSPLPTN